MRQKGHRPVVLSPVNCFRLRLGCHQPLVKAEPFSGPRSLAVLVGELTRVSVQGADDATRAVAAVTLLGIDSRTTAWLVTASQRRPPVVGQFIEVQQHHRAGRGLGLLLGPSNRGRLRLVVRSGRMHVLLATAVAQALPA